jgi:murein DD-endopeptidase MepM/ murein hydrolase activator NlpD
MALAGAFAAGSDAGSPSGSPKATETRCLERCAGRQRAAVGATVRITGRRLGGVTEVGFPGPSGDLPREPRTAGRHRVLVTVPDGARRGRLHVVDADGRGDTAPGLRIVAAAVLPAPGSFDLLGTRVRPHKAFLDGRRGVRLRYRFRSSGPLDVTVTLVRGGRIVRTWTQRSRLPYTAHSRGWNGMRKHRKAAATGRYRFKLETPGNHAHPTRRFRLHAGKFPVRGPHSFGDSVQRFGAPRNGGRVHQGQDVFASCGTPVVAAWGGRVQARGSDPALYGNWAVIDGRGTRTDFRYAHFLHPASVHDGERVRTGGRVGRVGKTGNARTVGCMLHFEIWPSGWDRGGPVDPLPSLRRWDSWS